jgi:hypothetical protein
MSVFDNDNPTPETPAATPSGRKPKTFEQWQKIRRTNPSLYYSGTTIRKINEDRETLGKDAFYKRTPSDEEV